MIACSSTPIPRSRWRKGLLWAALFVAAGSAAADYAVWHARKRQALAVVADLGGRAGGIGGWPLGEELVISFNRDLTDEEIQRLAILNSLAGRRHYVGVGLPPGNLSGDRRAWIELVLSRCHVCSTDPNQRDGPR
jgi:hypothetical protein